MVPAGYRLIEIESTGSTNTACLEAAQAGDPGNLWIRAERQMQGRGSRGRPWVSEPGNLYASLLLIDPAPMAAIANLTFVAALGLRDALGELAETRGARPEIRLKWPNDVLIGGAKTSGILLEHHTVEGRSAVIVGIGVDCASHPAGTTHRATDLAAEGLAVAPRDLFDLLASHFDRWLARWDRGAGFPAVRSAWLDSAAGRGDSMVARLPKRELTGIFEDIDRGGHLRLRLKDGKLVAISAADIFLRESAIGKV